MIKILLVDDHAMVRRGLRLALERQPDMTVVAEAGDGATAIDLALRLQPTVVLMDVGLPHVTGLAALSAITARAPRVRVLLLTGLADAGYQRRAQQEGAAGYLHKEGRLEDLVEAVRTVAQGGFVFDGAARMPGCLAQQDEQPLPAPCHDLLTVREQEVLSLVAHGHSNSTAGQQLGISPKTVDTHRVHLMDKLNLHSRAALTRYAMQNGYVVPAV
jgi:two-component system response regulator NreC